MRGEAESGVLRPHNVISAELKLEDTMRKGTMLTSGVLDEITAQARYQSLLEAAERRRLIQQIQGNSPNWLDRLFLAVGNRLITWGLWIKDHGAPAASLDDTQTALD
jgi:hypothetical protein